MAPSLASAADAAFVQTCFLILRQPKMNANKRSNPGSLPLAGNPVQEGVVAVTHPTLAATATEVTVAKKRKPNRTSAEISASMDLSIAALAVKLAKMEALAKRSKSRVDSASVKKAYWHNRMEVRARPIYGTFFDGGFCNIDFEASLDQLDKAAVLWGRKSRRELLDTVVGDYRLAYRRAFALRFRAGYEGWRVVGLKRTKAAPGELTAETMGQHTDHELQLSALSGVWPDLSAAPCTIVPTPVWQRPQTLSPVLLKVSVQDVPQTACARCQAARWTSAHALPVNGRERGLIDLSAYCEEMGVLTWSPGADAVTDCDVARQLAWD